MMHARLPLLLAGTAVLALSLTACEQPNPGATVFSGTTSQWRQAACWAGEGESIDANACAQDVIEKAAAGGQLASIPVVPGQTVGISVDPVVADAGWSPRINGQNLTQSPITSTYFRFTFPEFQEVAADGLMMELVAGQADATRGVWLFQLVPA
jgi:hypothetical protein